MTTFISTHGLFQLELSACWMQTPGDDIYTFHKGEDGGAFQISVMFHAGGKQFILEDELAKEQKEYLPACITDLSQYGAVHYALDLREENLLQYRWITGHQHVKMFCTLTISSALEDQKLDEVYEEVVAILNTLKIFPPKISNEEKLRNNIIDQAKFFLTDAGEFYPFGTYITSKDEIVPVGVYMDNKNPTSPEVLKILTDTMTLKLSAGEAKMAGIGSDVFYSASHETEKKSAIHIQVLQTNGDKTDYYMPYVEKNGNFTYENPFQE